MVPGGVARPVLTELVSEPVVPALCCGHRVSRQPVEQKTEAPGRPFPRSPAARLPRGQPRPRATSPSSLGEASRVHQPRPGPRQPLTVLAGAAQRPTGALVLHGAGQTRFQLESHDFKSRPTRQFPSILAALRFPLLKFGLSSRPSPAPDRRSGSRDFHRRGVGARGLRGWGSRGSGPQG